MGQRVKDGQSVRRMRIGRLDRECTACEDKKGRGGQYVVATFTDETSVVVLRQ